MLLSVKRERIHGRNHSEDLYILNDCSVLFLKTDCRNRLLLYRMVLYLRIIILVFQIVHHVSYGKTWIVEHKYVLGINAKTLK